MAADCTTLVPMIGFGGISVEIDDDLVAIVEWHRGPNNHFDLAMIRGLADALEYLDSTSSCRVAMLCSEGKHFCAGADLASGRPLSDTTQRKDDPGHLYVEALRLFSYQTPLVAVVQGGAIGGGLGLAMAADFRIAEPDARFSANFAKLGFHHGFGLTVTLPAVVGQQRAWDMLYTGRRVGADEALQMGLCDQLAKSNDSLRADAHAFAAEIAMNAPLAVRAIRATMRRQLATSVRLATEHERIEQERLVSTDDFREGVRASTERRTPRFKGI